jgi:hypothetical protein
MDFAGSLGGRESKLKLKKTAEFSSATLEDDLNPGDVT